MGVKGENTALYRRYRSRSLAEVVGQSHVTDVLTRSLAKGKIAHAYLLTGPRGVGKTSIARILAHEINHLPYNGEETHLDIIEIDAASNNGVDDVRDLREKVRLAPTMAAKKVYIIDEVHMLSKAAFNALLKTLEEPPAHVVFILATTDLHKVPATIISRTQHFAFHSISPTDIATHLKSIAASEKITISDEALAAIATRGDGSFRDSISLLDQLTSFADDTDGITLELVESTLGLAPTESVSTLLGMVASRDIAGIISLLDELETGGIQPVVLADQLIRHVRLQLAEQPQLVTLLDSLLSVAGSSQPQLKLLIVLVGAVKPRSAAMSVSKASTLVIEAPVPKAAAPKKPVPVAKKPESAPKAATKPEPASQPVTPVSQPPAPENFDWSKVIDYTKKNLIPLYSVLIKCEYELEGANLTIYADRKFNKTKLDEAKYLAQLHVALNAIGAGTLEITTLAETKPPSDEKLAKVAAIMGGGREVSVGETSETQ